MKISFLEKRQYTVDFWFGKKNPKSVFFDLVDAQESVIRLCVHFSSRADMPYIYVSKVVVSTFSVLPSFNILLLLRINGLQSRRLGYFPYASLWVCTDVAEDS